METVFLLVVNNVMGLILEVEFVLILDLIMEQLDATTQIQITHVNMIHLTVEDILVEMVN